MSKSLVLNNLFTKSIIISSLCFIMTVNCLDNKPCNYITDYYQTVYQAEIHYLKNENQAALDSLKKAEAKCGCLLNQIGTYEPNMMAELLVRLNREDEAFQYLYDYLENGMEFSVIDSNPEFGTLKKHKSWKKLEKSAPKITAKFQKSINSELRKEIIKMTTDDQKVRNGEIDYEALKKVDSINENRMKEIFQLYGYPNPKLVGHSLFLKEDTDINAMLMHFNDTTYFKPVLLEFIKKGEASPHNYASMIDSNQRSIGEFTYGVYQNVDSTSIKNFHLLDERRVAIGLRPYKLEQEYWRLISERYKF